MLETGTGMGKSGRRDVVVIGAGIFGLSCAWACLARGLDVTILDRAGPGAGASGGFVGALSPHTPDFWIPKKQFQLDALLSAQQHWRGVAEAGGIDPGYERIGRLLPLTSACDRERANERVITALDLWPSQARWNVKSRDELPGFISRETAPFGAVLETLSARVHPRRAVAALAAAIKARGAQMQAGAEVTSVQDGRITLADDGLEADAIILAAGTGSTALMEPLLGLPLGKGIKGQAALLRPAGPAPAHLIYADGIYIVPHADGTVAVGSTSEREYASPTGTDARLDALIARARAICPGLAHAPVIERWAALRPRGARPMPMLGRLPGTERVFVAGGGFKIGFGIAHKAGQVLADMITGREPALPPVFTVTEHLAAQQRDNAAKAGPSTDI